MATVSVVVRIAQEEQSVPAGGFSKSGDTEVARVHWVNLGGLPRRPVPVPAPPNPRTLEPSWGTRLDPRVLSMRQDAGKNYAATAHTSKKVVDDLC